MSFLKASGSSKEGVAAVGPHEVELLRLILQSREKANVDASRISRISTLMQKQVTKNVKLFSEVLMEKRANLAGHIMRTPQQDRSRKASYQPASARMFRIGKRRVSRGS